jgi:hypothetical protein
MLKNLLTPRNILLIVTTLLGVLQNAGVVDTVASATPEPVLSAPCPSNLLDAGTP